MLGAGLSGGSGACLLRSGRAPAGEYQRQDNKKRG
jgi:hypothetical protein